VSQWWTKTPEECFVEYSGGRKAILSQESQNLILAASHKQRKSCNNLVLEILEKRGKTVSFMTIYRYRVNLGLKPFHVISKPLKTKTQIEDRLWLCEWLSEWDASDFIHLAPSDEFFVWCVQKPNHMNDRIWAKSVEDIEESERYRELVRNQACIGIFVLFTAKKLLWIVKPQGQSWDGNYFRETILKNNVIPFLKNDENVISIEDVTFVHDKAPCMKARATQQLLRESNIDFWGNDIWPGNSPDLNPAEHLGAIIKGEVETRMLSETGPHRFSLQILTQHVTEVLKQMENETELFETLLLSWPERIEAVRRANGGHTRY
jgi:hypothetical protein